MKKLQLSWKWLGLQSFDFTSHFIVTFYRANTYDCYSEYLEYRLYTISFSSCILFILFWDAIICYIKDPTCEKFILVYILLLFKKFSCLSNVNEIKKHQVLKNMMMHGFDLGQWKRVVETMTWFEWYFLYQFCFGLVC